MRRSSRVATNEAEAASKMHAEALDATKAWFQEMGKEMRIAEDQEAAELFAQQVMDQETTTNTVCVMLDSVEEDSEDEDSDEEGDFSGDEDEDAEPSEVSGSDEEDDDEDEDDSDSDSDDPMWAPDGMQQRLERALKVFVPAAVADALETLQLTMSLAEVVPGVGADLATKVIAGAESALAKKQPDPDAAFASAFAATVAMMEADALSTWAGDKKVATKLLRRLELVWVKLYEVQKTMKKEKGVLVFGALDTPCAEALATYLKERCSAKWGVKSETNETGLGLGGFNVFAAATGSGKGKKRARE